MATYFICPHCEAKVPSGALACPECGSDKNTGWAAPVIDDTVDDDLILDLSSKKLKPVQNNWKKYTFFGGLIVILITFIVVSVPRGLYGVPIILLILGGFYLVAKQPKNISNSYRAIYQSLLDQARGDTALVERLIEYERKREPHATKEQLARNALLRWQRDRR